MRRRRWQGGALASLLVWQVLDSGTALAALDINQATRSELEAVKGIGPAKAQAIISYRQRHGPFARLEALSQVRGFGSASVRRLQSDLCVCQPISADTSHRKP